MAATSKRRSSAGKRLNCRSLRIGDLHQAKAGHIYIHDVTQLEISSSDIRELVASGRDPRFLLPDAVRDVIDRSGCYARASDDEPA